VSITPAQLSPEMEQYRRREIPTDQFHTEFMNIGLNILQGVPNATLPFLSMVHRQKFSKPFTPYLRMYYNGRAAIHTVT